MAKYTLIIRPQPDADRDASWLQRYHVPALASPVMYASPITQKPDIAALMPSAMMFSGVIFTSRHALDGMIQVGGLNEWRDKPAFTVGKATAAAARQAGFSRVITGNGGGNGLIQPIRDYLAGKYTNPDQAALFWPSARDISFDMGGALAAFNIPVTRVPVYQMLPADGLSPAVIAALSSGEIGAVIAMSARSINLFCDALMNISSAKAMAGIKLIAGSEGIARAAGTGWREVFVAKSPRRSRLLAIAVLLNSRMQQNGE